MNLKQSRFKYWPLRQWRCCDRLWELLISKKYPTRFGWHPTCPDCGSTMKILKVGIVGSRSRDTQEDKEIIRSVLVMRMAKGDHIHLVSGGCRKGADRFAEELAEEFDLGISIHYPDVEPNCARWEYAQACYERNLLIAEECSILLACWDGVSGGTKHTVDNVEKLNKPVVIL